MEGAAQPKHFLWASADGNAFLGYVMGYRPATTMEDVRRVNTYLHKNKDAADAYRQNASMVQLMSSRCDFLRRMILEDPQALSLAQRCNIEPSSQELLRFRMIRSRKGDSSLTRAMSADERNEVVHHNACSVDIPASLAVVIPRLLPHLLLVSQGW